MKKQSTLLYLLSIFAVVAMVTLAFAQDTTVIDTTGGSEPAPPAPSPAFNIIAAFGSIGGVVLLVTILTGWLLTNTFLKNLTATAKQYVSWFVAIGLAYFGWWKDFGMFESLDWIMTGITGIGIAMVANHMFDAGTLDGILKSLGAKDKSKV